MVRGTPRETSPVPSKCVVPSLVAAKEENGSEILPAAADLVLVPAQVKIMIISPTASLWEAEAEGGVRGRRRPRGWSWSGLMRFRTTAGADSLKRSLRRCETAKGFSIAMDSLLAEFDLNSWTSMHGLQVDVRSEDVQSLLLNVLACSACSSHSYWWRGAPFFFGLLISHSSMPQDTTSGWGYIIGGVCLWREFEGDQARQADGGGGPRLPRGWWRWQQENRMRADGGCGPRLCRGLWRLLQANRTREEEEDQGCGGRRLG